ncbi:MAG: hypothetical protein V3U60_15565 [Gammaproteobacteria bacterium]|jgi:hypothetical protein
MKRREFNKYVVLAPASGALLSIPRLADAATPENDRNSLLGFSDRDPKNAATRHAPPPLLANVLMKAPISQGKGLSIDLKRN